MTKQWEVWAEEAWKRIFDWGGVVDGFPAKEVFEDGFRAGLEKAAERMAEEFSDIGSLGHRMTDSLQKCILGNEVDK